MNGIAKKLNLKTKKKKSGEFGIFIKVRINN